MHLSLRRKKRSPFSFPRHWCALSAVRAIFLVALSFTAPTLSAADKTAPAPAANAATKKADSATNSLLPNQADQGLSAATLLSRVFEERAAQILERYIPVRDFQVTAKVTASGKALPSAPYDPKGLSTGTLSNLQPEELDSFVKQVKIDVLLNERLTSTRPKIQALLAKSLNLKPKRGDRITFGNLGIEVVPDEWVKEKSDLKRSSIGSKSREISSITSSRRRNWPRRMRPGTPRWRNNRRKKPRPRTLSPATPAFGKNSGKRTRSSSG